MRFSLAAKWRLLVTAALWAAVAVSGQEITRTQITDTLFNANGSRAVGSLRISWKAFTGVDGSTVAKNSIDLDIVDGIVSVALAPNVGAVPDGTYYSVEYRLHKGEKSNELWIVPDSEDPVSIADIRVLSIPAAGMSVSLSQVNGLPALLSTKADKAATNTFTAPQVMREDMPGTSTPMLGLQKNNGAAGVYFRLPELSGDVAYTMPPNAGSPNQALTTDGSGALFWSAAAGEGAGYEVLQQGGTIVTQRTAANFTSGFVVSDNADQLRTDITPNWGTAAGAFTQGNDSRLSDARTPLAHASTHAAAGSDPLTPASIGALNRTNDFMVGVSPTTPVLKLQGSTGQAAALQEWRDGNGGLAALITAQGSGFFRELGVSAPAGGSTVSQFFEIGGVKKFALSATDGVFDFLRYDNAGAFLDRPLRVFRNGKIETTTSLKVADAGIGIGTLGLSGDYIELQSVSAPSTPASSFGRLFLNSANGEVSVKKSTGTIVSLEQGGSDGGSGDVVGPTDAADNRFARFDSTTGKLIQSSLASLDDNGFPTWGIGFAGGWARVTGGAGKTSASSHYIYGGDVDSEPSWLGLQQGDASSKQEAFLQPCVDGVNGRMCLSATTPTADSSDWILTQGNHSCVDSIGTDSYACSVSPPIGSYAAGHQYCVRTGTANTGAATVSLNGLSAMPIKKNHDQDLITGDIEAGQWVCGIYDGTNLQMTSQLAQ